MKKLSLLLFVVCFMVVTLCGCNCESDDSKNQKIAESIYQEDVTQNVDSTKSSVDKENDEKSQKDKDKSSAITDKADDSANTRQYSTTNNHSDKKSEKNSTSSSSKTSNEVYEAEIDFSELE